MTTENEVSTGAETQNPAPEQQNPEVAEPEVVAEETTEPESAEDPRDKALKALQRRIDKRTRDTYEARARADRAEQELAEIRARHQTQEPAETREVDVDALAAQKAEQITEQRELARKVQATLAKGKALEGFDAAVNTAVEELSLMDRKGQPTPLLKAILEGDAAHEVLYHIGQNPEVAAEFDGLTPTQAARRLVKLETELAQAKAPKTSKAPAPLKPVTASAKNDDYSPNMSDADYAAWRQKQIKARRA